MSALVIEAGQSLALGYRVGPAELPADYTPDAHVKIWVRDHFETMVAGVNTGTPANADAWGPEVAFSRDWVAEHPGQTLYLVKSVKGSTGIAEDPGQLDWSPASGELFAQTTDAVAAARQAAHAPVTAILWVQGNQDALDPAKAASYAANEADLFAHMRADWAGGADTPVVFAQLGGHGPEPYAQAVRDAQALVAANDDRAVLIDADPFDYQADRTHLTGAGEIQLGHALNAGLDLVTASPWRDWVAPLFHADWIIAP